MVKRRGVKAITGSERKTAATTAMKGGGYMLFAGCAAGDTAAALVLKVG